DAGEVQPRALARRGRSALHRRGARPVPHPSARRAGVRDRGGGRRSDPCAARHPSLVRPLRRQADPRDPPLPGHVRLDAALHRQRRRQGVRARVLRPRLRGAPLSATEPSERPAEHVLLLDIEGTTTPISFVTDTLFPYARARLASFLAGEGRADETAAFLAEMDRDGKSTELKALQGRIWEAGYASGELTG